MKTFNKIAAQGDLMLIRVPDLDTSALALVEPHDSAKHLSLIHISEPTRPY